MFSNPGERFKEYIRYFDMIICFWIATQGTTYHAKMENVPSKRNFLFLKITSKTILIVGVGSKHVY